MLADLDSLPSALTSEQAAELLGMSRGALWAAARDGDAPVEPYRVGRALRWPTAPILALLGLGSVTQSPDVTTPTSVRDHLALVRTSDAQPGATAPAAGPTEAQIRHAMTDFGTWFDLSRYRDSRRRLVARL